MMYRKLVSALTGLALLAIAAPAHAAFVETALPTNTYISKNGFEWAWAYPLPASSGGFDLSYQSQFGWRIPTANELLLAPLAIDFIFLGANVPLGGIDPVSGASFSATNGALTGAAACATAYFSTAFRHCDWQDGLGQPNAPWAGMRGAEGFADQLVIRLAAVPEPASAALFGAGLFGLGWLSRRRKAARAA